MNPFFTAKQRIKILRWELRRNLTAAHWGSHNLQKSPTVLGNSMPKSGSHLITQVLKGFTRLGPFVNTGFPPVNRSENNHKLRKDEVIANIEHMRPGDISYGYIKSEKDYIALLTQSNRATVFLYRDPRDMIVSHVFYATQIHPGHGMHEYYTEKLTSMEERINAAIRGVNVPGSELSPIRVKYDGYMDWLNQPDILSLRFEDLILNRGFSLGELLDFLNKRGFPIQIEHEKAIAVLESTISHRKSGTYRKAQPGNWREHFTEANKAIFKEHTGDLLERLEYEKDGFW